MKLLLLFIVLQHKDYEHVIKEAQQAFLAWRNVPAPKRGEVVRAIGDELRKYKDILGSLVSLKWENQNKKAMVKCKK